MASVKISVTLQKDLLDRIDEQCKTVNLNRSKFIAEACVSKIAEYETIQVIKANPEAYRDMILQIAKGLE